MDRVYLQVLGAFRGVLPTFIGAFRGVLPTLNHPDVLIIIVNSCHATLPTHQLMSCHTA
jgi:hypothetical protein